MVYAQAMEGREDPGRNIGSGGIRRDFSSRAASGAAEAVLEEKAEEQGGRK